MKILVTGASGLLGTRISRLALEHNHEVIAAYNQHIPRFGSSIKLDITNHAATSKVFEKSKPETIIHAAALPDVDRCEKEKELAWKINAEATSNIAKLSHEHNSFLIYISTDYVFDGSKGGYTENDPTSPINYYGLTKLKGEEAVLQSRAEHCIARTSVLFGSIPSTGKTNFALWLIEKLGKKEQAKAATDQWNSPTLNSSLAEMTLEVSERKVTGILHLAGATRLTRYEFAQHVAETFKLDKNLIKPASSTEMPWVAKRPKDSSLNVDKAKQMLKNKPLQISEALSRLKMEMS